MEYEMLWRFAAGGALLLIGFLLGMAKEKNRLTEADEWKEPTTFQGRPLPSRGQKIFCTLWNGQKIEGRMFLDMDDKPGLTVDLNDPEFTEYEHPANFAWGLIKEWSVINEIEE